MYAVVRISKKVKSVIITKVENIDWDNNEVVDNSELLEKEIYLSDIIDIYNIDDNNSKKIKFINFDKSIHRIVIEGKLYIALNII